MSAVTIEHKLLRKPQQNLARLEADFAGAGRALEVEGAARRAAEDADRKALADAFRQDKQEPKPSGAAVAERHEAAKRRFKALETAVEDAREELAQAEVANRPAIERDLLDALAEVRPEMLDLLKAFASKNLEASVLEAQLNRLKGGKGLMTEPLVPGFPKPNGDDSTVGDLLIALETRCHPREPKIVGAPRPPLQRAAAGAGVFVGGGAG